jgi:hypothetical protein
MAYLSPDGAFARTMNTQVSRAMEQMAEAGFRNSVSDEVCLTCVRCCEKIHGKKYVNEEKGMVTSQFGNLAKLSKNCRIPDKKLQKIIGSISEKCVRKGEEKLDADKVIKMFQAPELVGSTDWVTSIGPCSVLLYGCHECGIYPTRSSSWWRCATDTGSVGRTETGGHWRCANCTTRWQWKTGGHLRLLVIGNSERNGDMWMAFIGSSYPSSEAKLNFLKAIRIFATLGDKTASLENVLDCLEILNQQSDTMLSRCSQYKLFEAKDVSWTGAKVYCEDQRLSLNRSGTWFGALAMAGEKCIATPSPAEVDAIVDTLAAMLDVESGLATTPASKDAKWSILSSPTFGKTRSVLASIVLGKK